MRDISFSFSHLSMALRCNKLFDLRVLQGLTPDEPESGAMLFGTALHAGINDILEGGSGEAFGFVWETALNSLEIDFGRHNYQTLHDMGGTFLARFKRLHAPHLTLVHGEQRLKGTLPGGVRIEGTPDFAGLYKGAKTLMDFKTAGSAYPEGKVNASDQLLLYAWLVDQVHGYRAEQVAYMVFVKSKEPRIQVQTAAIDWDHVTARMHNFETLCQELLAKEKFACNYNACFDYNRRCGFWAQCHKRDVK